MENQLRVAVRGMTCAACSARIERVVRAIPGVQEASVNLASEELRLTYDPAVVTLELIAQKVSAAGFSMEMPVAGSDANMSDTAARWEEKTRDERSALAHLARELYCAFAFAVPLLYLSMGEMIGLPLPAVLSPHHAPLVFALAQVLLCVPVLWLGRRFYLVGVPALFRWAPNMDTLVALGTGAAFLYSVYTTVAMIFLPHDITYAPRAMHLAMDLYFESAAVLIALVSLGKYLELRSRSHTSDAIKGLLDLSPEQATLVRDGTQQVVPLAAVQVGNTLLVKPGERIPVDGIVLDGSSAVDESMLTGESMPVTKMLGASLAAGTLNGQGALTMRADRIGADTVLARIISLVREAQGSKAPIARLADTVSLYFVPTVMSLAVAAAVFWFVRGEDIGFCVRILVSVLVIACPCAMGLATPMSIMVGTGRGAQLGVLVKDGGALEAASHLDVLVFDKTGTVTRGKPELTDIVPLDGNEFDNDSILRLAASVEAVSEHPLAAAVVAAAHMKNLDAYPIREFSALPGKGVTAVVTMEGKALAVHIGNLAYSREHCKVLPQNLEQQVEALAAQGKTVLIMNVGDTPVALLAVADTIRPEAKSVLESLRMSNIRIIMLTGDIQQTAEAVAAAVGVREVRSGVLPADKEACIKELQAQGLVVGMVGDGINDAPALARADVGIAMGSGIDVAMEAGDIVLMQEGLEGIHNALALSRGVMRNIRENLFWAFGYNVLGIPVAMGFLHLFGGPTLSPMIAGGAMALSSVSVVMNALRLRRFRAISL